MGNNKKSAIGSYRRILVPIIRFESYELIRDKSGAPKICGIGSITKEHVDYPSLYLELYVFGEKVVRLIKEKGISINEPDVYYRFALEWAKDHGFPFSPEPLDNDEDKVTYNTFSIIDFYLNVLVYRSVLDSAYKINDSKSINNVRHHVDYELGIPSTNWGRVNNGERRDMLMQKGNGIGPYIEYSDELQSYTFEYRAYSHISAACAQIAMALVDKLSLTRTCIECGESFVFIGKEKTCSPYCRSKRRSHQSIKVRNKPVEQRNPKMRRARKMPDGGPANGNH